MAAPKSTAKKQEGQKVRMLDGKVVKPVLYIGRAVGHGKYFTGEVDGKLVCDDSGKPLPFRQIGELYEV